MSEIDENRKVQKITRLLERGGTMLATHHECGAPLFRYQGKIVCPVCDFEEKKEMQEIKKSKEQERRVEKGQIEPEVEPEVAKKAEQKETRLTPTKEPQAARYPHIATLTKDKILSIALSLENETDLQRIKEKLECIELGIRILKLLEC